MTYTIIEATGVGDDWLRRRQPMITASDAPVIVNMSPYKTPHQLWVEKTAPTITDDDRDLFYFAHELESPIVRRVEQKWADEFGGRTHKSPGLISWDPAPFLGATPDATVDHRDGEIVPLQVKTVNSFARKAWGEMATANDVPDHYRIQVIQEAKVMGAPGGYLVPLEGIHRLHRPIWIPVDEEFWDWYFDHATAWHQRHMIERQEPDITFGDDWAEHWPGARGVEKVATPEIATAAIRAKVYRDTDRKRLEEQDEADKAAIAEFLQDATELVDPFSNEVLVTYRPKASPVYFDLAAFKAAHPAIYGEFTRPGKPQRSMLFKKSAESTRAIEEIAASREEREAHHE